MDLFLDWDQLERVILIVEDDAASVTEVDIGMDVPASCQQYGYD